MDFINTETKENVTIIRLDNGVTNAITLAMVRELSAVLKEIEKAHQGKNHGIVLTGNSKFLSMGFDLPALIKEDRNGMARFFYDFNQVALELYTLAFPTIASISGHAAAGGCILSLMCDFRFAVAQKKLGLNELLLGLPVPYLADMVLRQITNDRVATTLMYQGSFIPAADALGSGLIDKLFVPEEVEENAVKKAASLAMVSGPAFAATKKSRVEWIQQQYEKHHKIKNEFFLDCWFSDTVQELLKKASEKF